jgi:uncharacterized protein YndB with AHSA1/START domain
VDTNDFFYTTYVSTTPEKLWQALTDPAFTQLYWGTTFDTDWKPGSRLVWNHQGVIMDDPEQVVIESQPYRRLVYTWHTITPEFAETVGITEDLYSKLAAEKLSRVSFDIEPVGEAVKLTVVHSGFEPGSALREMIGEGWPSLLSSLKTLLETGQALPI